MMEANPPNAVPLKQQELRPRVPIDYRRARDLSPSEWNSLWSLVSEHIRSSRESFERGLLAMDEVWLYSTGGALKGFGGVRIFHPEVEGRKACVIFTGRVFLAADVRGQNIIQRVGLRYYLRELRARPRRPIHWMFGAGTYKSYLLLSRNFRDYWPRPGADIPLEVRALYEAVAAEMQNPAFDPVTAILRQPELIYLDGTVGLDPEALREPDVAFYARINPGQVNGDGVVCLAPLSLSNWTSIARRIAGRMLWRMLH